MLVGACGSGRSCYDSLEIKSVQLDTLGHVSVLQAMDAAHYNMAAAICSATNCFFVSAAKDVMTLLFFCYLIAIHINNNNYYMILNSVNYNLSVLFRRRVSQ